MSGDGGILDHLAPSGSSIAGQPAATNPDVYSPMQVNPGNAERQREEPLSNAPRQPRSGMGDDYRMAPAPLSASGCIPWRGAVLTDMTWDHWKTYHFVPASYVRRLHYKESRPSRPFTSFAEYELICASVDNTVPCIEEARRLLVDSGLLEEAMG